MGSRLRPAGHSFCLSPRAGGTPSEGVRVAFLLGPHQDQQLTNQVIRHFGGRISTRLASQPDFEW
jgi:hypothetical protein